MSNSTRTLAWLAGLGLAVAGVGHAPVAQAHTQVAIGVRIGVPPPPPRIEVVPRPRPGFIWAPGYWRWSARTHRHVWAAGYWVPVRRGMHYEPAHWEHHGHDWRLRGPHWRR